MFDQCPIGNPPAGVQSEPEVLVEARDRRIGNPPQIANLPHNRLCCPCFPEVYRAPQDARSEQLDVQ
jgi:hypothetical protein